jgi:hypothetical protein
MHESLSSISVGTGGLTFLGLKILFMMLLPWDFMFYHGSLNQSCSKALFKRFAHINLVRRPTVHSQGLDLRDMGAQFAVQRSTSHAQEDSHLLPNHQYLEFSK